MQKTVFLGKIFTVFALYLFATKYFAKFSYVIGKNVQKSFRITIIFCNYANFRPRKERIYAKNYAFLGHFAGNKRYIVSWIHIFGKHSLKKQQLCSGHRYTIRFPRLYIWNQGPKTSFILKSP